MAGGVPTPAADMRSPFTIPGKVKRGCEEMRIHFFTAPFLLPRKERDASCIPFHDSQLPSTNPIFFAFW